jgi:hypothetical protein
VIEQANEPDRIIIQWSCGCAVYEDRTGRRWDQESMFCSPETHRAQVVKTSREGEETRQGGLF